MGKEAFDRKVAAIAALREAPAVAAVTQLRRALGDRSNYIVAKAAAVAAQRGFAELAPDLAAAFERFLKDPAKSDPQCWGKNAVAKALKDLGHTDPAVYRRGAAHVQMEAVWGGREDTAATLRGRCALALVACSIETLELLTLLTGMLNDAAVSVRIDAARAIAQVSAREGALPLRLKALVGDEEPEVVGQCFASLIDLDAEAALPFVAEFLRGGSEEVRMEAVGALAGCREPRAIGILREFWGTVADAELRRAVLRLVASSPVPEAGEFLVAAVEEAGGETAVDALTALAQSRYGGQLRARVESVVAAKGDSRLTSAFEAAFGRPAGGAA